MPDERLTPSRRRFLKGAGVAAVAGIGGLYVAQIDNLGAKLTAEGKKAAERLRSLPGLGYEGQSVALNYLVGGRDILTASKDQQGYWRGAPALSYVADMDTLLTHVRHRDPVDRGKRVTIHQINLETLQPNELVSIHKDELDARSLEGGELVEEDGEFRWFISYQESVTGKWRIQERRASTLSGLEDGGSDLDIVSDYYHHKDPTVIEGDLYVISNSNNWLDSAVERVSIDEKRPAANEIPVEGVANARITTGGILKNELFADTWPDFPGTGVSNFLWTADERSANGTLTPTSVRIQDSEHYVSACGTSTTYVDATVVGDAVYILWQEEKCDGSNDLVGARISVSEYRRLFI